MDSRSPTDYFWLFGENKLIDSELKFAVQGFAIPGENSSALPVWSILLLRSDIKF